MSDEDFRLVSMFSEDMQADIARLAEQVKIVDPIAELDKAIGLAKEEVATEVPVVLSWWERLVVWVKSLFVGG
jgi:hypothetical protein